ncbi:hypothetical protein RYZ26_09865 [Terasakiella sp. A23]|uniref:hypothetical protein n=1 Tax=Terasakiella sp. FCG-A23 TaxID=3080561 RepID=UPI002954222E|nr:hypothetical protein [Terasakiella sp. A23]MDV7339900.1 hypothetical protein [Terasakiella sp. A23]
MKQTKTAHWGTDFLDWHIPLAENDVPLKRALEDMHLTSHDQGAIPLIVQVIENPKYQLPYINPFHGAVDLNNHDCIHILLGRGMRSKDEAFVIGFTMGSTQQVGCLEERLYQWAARYLYPGVYKFSDDDLSVFKQTLHLAMASPVCALDQVDFELYMDWPLAKIRKELGIDARLLKAAYRIEAQNFPQETECQRLLG